MANEIEIVVTGKDNTSSSFGSANKAAKEYGKGVEGVGEKADVAEQRTLGLKDTVDGVATIMQGPGKQGIAAYLQGWADLASGVANFIVPMAQAGIAVVRMNIATTVSTVKMKVAAAASKAWAAAQWLLNAAMSANPIVLVVIAIAALVAAFVIAYKKSETFRNIVNSLWEALKTGAKIAIGAVLTYIDFMLGALGKLLGAFGHLPGKLGAPFRAAADAIEGARNKVRELQATINGTRGKKVGVTVVVTQQGAEKVQRTIDNITGHVVEIQVGARGRGVTGYATGGIASAMGGGPRSNLVEVGEHGRELVRLPYGSRVYSNPDSNRMLDAGGSGGGKVELEINSGGARLDDLLIEILRKAIRVRGGDVQMALGS